MSDIVKHATVLDVARRAGVSHTTVSLALKGSSRVGPETTQRIREIAAELDYVPRAAAQLLRARQTGQLGLLIPGSVTTIESSFAGPILANFARVCGIEQVRYQVEFYESQSAGFRPPHMLSAQSVDGALVAGWVDPSMAQWLAERCRQPVVVLDEAAEYSVVSAADRGTASAVDYLVQMGHRRICCMILNSEYSVHRLGRQGLESAIARHKLGDATIKGFPGAIAGSDWRRQMAHAALPWIEELLRSKLRPTAMFCQPMPLARAVIYTALKMGLRVPEDLSVIAYGTAADAEKSLPCLTTIETNFAGLVENGLVMLRKRIAGQGVPERQVSVSPSLVPRDTVAAIG